MQSNFEEVYHQLEKNHFWFKARRKYITQELAQANSNSKILDVGCSSGLLLDDLIKLGFSANNLFGIDISEKAIINCKKNGFENTFVMDAQSINLNQKFDIIIASDCLEHLKDDDKALQNWYNLLKPNGIALVFVPAFMFLWSQHDEVNMHYRRYQRNELKNKLKNNGFEITKSSFWNFFLFLPILFVRSISKLFASKDNDTGDLNKLPMFNNVLLSLLKLENKLLKHINFPFGVSSYCIVKKS